MAEFTKNAVDVFAGYDAAGNPRQPIPHDAQVWGTDVERGFRLVDNDLEGVRSIAYSSASVYSSVAEGLAATSQGQQFQVVEDGEIVRYRHDSGPTATEVARFPSAEAVKEAYKFSDTALHPFSIFRDGTDGALYDATNPLYLGVQDVGPEIEHLLDYLGSRNLTIPDANTSPELALRKGRFTLVSNDVLDILRTTTPILPGNPTFVLVWNHITETDGMKAFLWQHGSGQPGRVQIVANGVYNGTVHFDTTGRFQVLINGATDGSGAGGQPRAAIHPLNDPAVFALVLRPGSGSSEFWRNGVLVDTFTAPGSIFQTETRIFRDPGFGASNSAGQAMNRLIVINKEVDQPTFDFVCQWVADGFGLSWGNGPDHPYVEPDISATSAVCMQLPIADFLEPAELFSKSADDQHTPASLTKLVTCVTAMGLLAHFSLPVTYQLTMQSGDATGGSGDNLQVGDQFSVQDGLANLLLPSSNVTATVTARTFGQILLDEESATGDPVERFVQEMNSVAAALGMSNSNFVNPHGLSATGQVSTAKDIFKVMREALKHSAITHVWGLATYNMQITGPNARTQQITTSVEMIADGDPDILGGKTGTIGSSVNNLAVYSSAPFGNRLITVAMIAPSDADRYADTRNILTAVTEGFDWPSLIPKQRT